jgi:hypothetical protein
MNNFLKSKSKITNVDFGSAVHFGQCTCSNDMQGYGRVQGRKAGKHFWMESGRQLGDIQRNLHHLCGTKDSVSEGHTHGKCQWPTRVDLNDKFRSLIYIVTILKDKFIITDQVSTNGFKFLCDRLNGTMPTPKTEQDVISMHDEAALLFETVNPSNKVCQLDSNRVTVHVGHRISKGTDWVNPYSKEVCYMFIQTNFKSQTQEMCLPRV